MYFWLGLEEVGVWEQTESLTKSIMTGPVRILCKLSHTLNAADIPLSASSSFCKWLREFKQLEVSWVLDNQNFHLGDTQTYILIRLQIETAPLALLAIHMLGLGRAGCQGRQGDSVGNRIVSDGTSLVADDVADHQHGRGLAPWLVILLLPAGFTSLLRSTVDRFESPHLVEGLENDHLIRIITRSLMFDFELLRWVVSYAFRLISGNENTGIYVVTSSSSIGGGIIKNYMRLEFHETSTASGGLMLQRPDVKSARDQG